MKINMDIEDLTDAQCRELLYIIVKELDNLDCEDFFGTEGWQRKILGESE